MRRLIPMLMIVLLVMTALAGCAKTQKGEVFETGIKWAKMFPDITINNPTEKSGLYKGNIYYVEETQSEINIRMVDMAGKETGNIKLPVGNGPGELRAMVSMRIYDDRVYAYDFALRKIAVFNMKGESIDDLNINQDIGMFGTLDIMGDYLYYHALFKNKLVKIALEDGSVVKKIEYEEPQTDLNNLAGKHLLRGTIKADPETKSIYIGYYNKPYRIEQYDEDLNLVRTLTRELDEKFEPMVFTAQGRGEGNIMITNLLIDSRYILACFGGGNRISGTSLDNIKVETIDRKMFLSVFDKKSGGFVGDITIKDIPLLKGAAGALGMDRDEIILDIIDMNDTLENVDVGSMDKEVNEIAKALNIKQALISINNPLKYD